MAQAEYRPGILVAHEKHGTTYYWARTLKELAAASLALLTQRFEDGWYYEPQPLGDAGPEMTQEQINSLPKGATRKAAQKIHDRWKSKRRADKVWRDTYDAIKQCVEQKDGQEAWYLLQDVSDHEYGRVSLERPYEINPS